MKANKTNVLIDSRNIYFNNFQAFQIHSSHPQKVQQNSASSTIFKVFPACHVSLGASVVVLQHADLPLVPVDLALHALDLLLVMLDLVLVVLLQRGHLLLLLTPGRRWGTRQYTLGSVRTSEVTQVNILQKRQTQNLKEAFSHSGCLYTS